MAQIQFNSFWIQYYSFKKTILKRTVSVSWFCPRHYFLQWCHYTRRAVIFSTYLLIWKNVDFSPFLYWGCFYHVLRRHAFCLQSADRLIRILWKTCPQYYFELTKLNWYWKIFTFLYDDSTIQILHFIRKQIATYSKFVDKTSCTSKTILILFKILFVFPLFNFSGSK